MRFRSFFSVSLFTLVLFAAPRAAEASDRVEPDARADETEVSRPSAMIRINPLPLLYSSLSAEIEIPVSPSVGILVNPQYVHFDDSRTGVPATYTGGSDQVHGFGGEVGFRYYPSTLAAGRAQVFVGPSLLGGHYESKEDFTRIGVAFDVGFALVMKSGFSLSAGGGLQLATNIGDPHLGLEDNGSATDTTDATIAFGDGPRPRALVSLGWAF
jgi:hypothetical protein